MQMPDWVMCFKAKVMSFPVRIRRLMGRLIFFFNFWEGDSGKMNVIISVLFFTFAPRKNKRRMMP